MLTENSQMTKLNNKMMGYNFWSHSFEVKSEKYGGLDFLKKKKKKSPKAKVQAWRMSWMLCWEQRSHMKLTGPEMYKKRSHKKYLFVFKYQFD